MRKCGIGDGKDDLAERVEKTVVERGRVLGGYISGEKRFSRPRAGGERESPRGLISG